LPFKNTPWEYRVVGPFSVPNFGGGSYSTVLTLRLFSRTFGGHAALTYSTGLIVKLDDDSKLEVDLTFWYARDRTFGRDDEPVLVFGETKSFAEESFKQQDVDRMKRLATKFPGAFLVFATLKDQLSEQEKAAISELAMWGRENQENGEPRAPVVVLTATELFADWNLHVTWKGLNDDRKKLAEVPAFKFGNLWSLASTTQQAYLGLPPG
jgi:hypothetical protein